MVSARRKFNSIKLRARREALAVLKDETARELPKGWRLHVAVGWGIVVKNADDKMVNPHDLSKRHQRLAFLAAEFSDTYAPGNEILRGRAIK